MALYPTTRYAQPFDQLFDTFFGNTGRTASGTSLMRAPETDVVETEKEIRVVTEMPGLKRENIEIDVENNVLTIRGEKREERTEGEEGRWHLAERRYGTFSRSFVASPRRGRGGHPGRLPGRRADRHRPQERKGPPPPHRDRRPGRAAGRRLQRRGRAGLILPGMHGGAGGAIRRPRIRPAHNCLLARAAGTMHPYPTAPSHVAAPPARSDYRSRDAHSAAPWQSSRSRAIGPSTCGAGDSSPAPRFVPPTEPDPSPAAHRSPASPPRPAQRSILSLAVFNLHD